MEVGESGRGAHLLGGGGGTREESGEFEGVEDVGDSGEVGVDVDDSGVLGELLEGEAAILGRGRKSRGSSS